MGEGVTVARRLHRTVGGSEGGASADDIIRLGALVLRFGRTNRATFHEDGQRPETDTDHTVMLSLIACAIASDGFWSKETTYHGFNWLNVARIAEFALVHDLVEAYAGDTQSFGLTKDTADAVAAKAAKAEREKAALKRICDEFAMFPWIERTIRSYEEQQEPEARFVRYLDKAMPKITHILNGAKTLKDMGKTKADVVEEHDRQMKKLREEYPEFPAIDDLLHTLCRKTDAELK